MNILQAITKYSSVETDLLLSHILGKPKEFLYTHPEYKLTSKQFNNLTKLILRRKEGEPIAYIVGYKYFYGLKFKVNKDVLIPRPETEWLVDRIIKQCTLKLTTVRNRSQIKILDVGTGSGCIPISIAHIYTGHKGHPSAAKGSPFLEITASDISPPALQVAKHNAAAHKTTIRFIQSDLFLNIRGKFDIITANLPYIPLTTYNLLLTTDIKFEPKSAITDGTDTWDLYTKFFTELPKYLKGEGIALLEIDEAAKLALAKMVKKILPTMRAKFYKDLSNRWRYLALQ